jgi:hypothetical protein
LKTVPSEMWKAQYSLSDRLYWVFHILEGTVFKLSTLCFAYYILIPILSLFVFMYISGNKNHAGLFRPLQIFNLFPWPTGLRPGSQMQKGLFSDLSPIHAVLLRLDSVALFLILANRIFQVDERS